MKTKSFQIASLLVLLFCSSAWSKSGDAFNPISDIHWEEIQLEFVGLCICPRPPPIFYEIGEIWRYWEPFIAIGTASQPFYYPFLGKF